ncbi:MAG: hypothetical protein QF554_04345 [Dehalococcoidia bacterium]|jgi:hypothetical protein|nr:hypothetical protein [Dehalococcoidia bacterium]
MRLSGFTRIGAMIGFFGAIAIMLISAVQFDSDEVSRKDVILAELLFGVPIFTIAGAALGAGWDFFEKRSAASDAREVESADIDPEAGSGAPPEPPRQHRRKPPGGRRRR